MKPGLNNLVKIDIDVLDETRWCVELAWGSLLINEGAKGFAKTVSLNTDKASYMPGETVAITTGVDTSLESQPVTLENNLIAPQNVILTGDDTSYTISGYIEDPQTMSLAIPPDAPFGQYTVEAIVYDTRSMDRQDARRITITAAEAAPIPAPTPTPKK